jgi:hypothetical protein
VTEPEIKLYGKAIPEALQEYVNQDVSGFANRYYDVGKFLFTVSTFAILAVFTLRSTFGSDYNIVFSSNLFFFFCLYPSYKLTVGIDYEIDPENTILKEYKLKKEWMKGYLDLWIVGFAIGIVVLIGSFSYAMINAKEKHNSLEVKLEEINTTLVKVLQEFKIKNEKPIAGNTICIQYEQLLTEISNLSQVVIKHDNQMLNLFVKEEDHKDRHLELITNKIAQSCSIK